MPEFPAPNPIERGYVRAAGTPSRAPATRIHVTTIPGEDPRRDELVEWLVTAYDACVHPDPNKDGLLGNHLGVVDCMIENDTAPWSITISDDVEPLLGWAINIDQALWHSPSPFLSLTHFSDFGDRLVRRGIPYGTGVNCIWGPAFAIKRTMLNSYRALVADVAEMDYDGYIKWDDGIPAVHNLLYGTTSSFTSRALFEHREWDSTYGHLPGRWRHAEATIHTHPQGPKWSSSPRSAKGGPGIEPSQRELAAKMKRYRKLNNPSRHP